MAFIPDPAEIGCLWRKSSAKGEYFTGMVNGQPVVVFANTRKTNEKAPDFRILKAKPREDRAPERQADRQAGPTDSEWD